MLNHEALVAEGNRHAETLLVIARLIKDTDNMIPEQKVVMQANTKTKMERLEAIRKAMDADCHCGHSKGHHQSGINMCHANGCECTEWEVEL